MLNLYVRLKDRIQNIHRDERGQDGFEYLLVIGGVMTVILGAIILAMEPNGLVNEVITEVEAKVAAVIT